MTETRLLETKSGGSSRNAAIDLTLDKPGDNLSDDDTKPLEEIKRQGKRIKFLEVRILARSLADALGAAA
jgi:hypothetical protein